MSPAAESAIVVVSYNTRALLLQCLASVSRAAAGAELVVVDNASTDGSAEAVRAGFAGARLIANPTNVGFSAACNQAIAATSAPFVLLLNSDARLNRDAFEALLACMRDEPRSGAAGCRLVSAEGLPVTSTRRFLTPLNHAAEILGLTDGPRWLRRTQEPRLDEHLRDCGIDWIDGSCLLLRRGALEEVGGLDEGYFLYGEDEDLCFRLRARGWRVCYTGAGTAVHEQGRSSADRTERFARLYAGHLRFLTRHRGQPSAAAFVVALRIALALKRLGVGALADTERRQELSIRRAALAEALKNK
jgi:GT2 family glycosyltransferase